jgi:VanZ family protein
MSTPTTANGTRHARLWYALGALLTLAVVVTSLLPARELPRLHVSDKLEHLLAYLSLAIWFGGLVRVRRYLWLALALLALGGSIEIAQGLMGLGREADWRDFIAGACGVGLGLLSGLCGLRHWVRWLEQWPRRS